MKIKLTGMKFSQQARLILDGEEPGDRQDDSSATFG